MSVHSPSSYPMPNEYGNDLQPNTASSLSVQKQEITRMPKPYTSDCYSQWSNTGLDLKKMKKNLESYSLAVGGIVKDDMICLIL